MLGNSNCVCGLIYLTHQGAGYDCFLNHKLMRLYIRPGLSTRVVAALQNRLRQAMSDGNGAHAAASPVRGGDQEERARSRSRAREEGVTEAHAPEESHQEEKENGGDAPGTPGAAKKVASRQELMKEIVACTKTLASATEDVSLALDEMKEARKEMSDGFKLLAGKMEDTCKAIVTMGASVTHQSAEITRMLRAFDKHAGVVKWALKTNAPLEQSILGISTDVTAKMEQLEGRVGLAFENVSKGMVQLIEAIQNPPGTPSVLQSGRFPPAFPTPHKGLGARMCRCLQEMSRGKEANLCKGLQVVWQGQEAKVCRWLQEAKVCRWLREQCKWDHRHLHQ